jgi:acetyltransferase-like isoleucine patch superfamily enzyme
MFSKITWYYSRLSKIDFLRKVIIVIFYYFGKLNFYRPLRALYYFKTASIKLGKNLRIHGLAFDINVGAKTYFYDNCVFEFGQMSQVKIGSNVVFSYGVILSCRKQITIGHDVQVGEYSSIRDTTHRYDVIDKPMKYSPDISEPIWIGNDVWIGRRCLILPGSVIEDGVVVAANSIVKGKLEKNGIYGGIPAKFIKARVPGEHLEPSTDR